MFIFVDVSPNFRVGSRAGFEVGFGILFEKSYPKYISAPIYSAINPMAKKCEKRSVLNP
jgi:hypothetical protein